MKQLFVLVTLVLFSGLAHSTNYYFSSVIGNDSRSAAQAQDPSTPWKSLQKLNAIFSTLQPGDSVLLRRGDVFDGKIVPSKSGTAAAGIVIAAYGTGSKPVINGLVTLKNFALYSGNIWMHAITTARPTILLVNDAQQPLGRYPNATDPNGGFLHFESHEGSGSITDYQLTSGTNWTGGEVVIRRNRWILDNNPITSHSGNTLFFTPSSTSEPANNFGYFIQNHLKALDRDGEWYFDKAQKKLYLYKSGYSAVTTDVKLSGVDTLVYNNFQNYLTYRDLHFRGANESALIITNCRSVSVVGCEISYSGANAVLINNASDIVVEGSSVQHSNNNAINTLYNCSNIRIRNNSITNTAVFPGMGKSGDMTYQAVTVKGKNLTVTGNRIENTGYIPIRFEGDSVLVENNFITNFCFLKDDGAGIYTWNNGSNATENSNRMVRNNVVMHGVGAGSGTSKPNEAHAHGIYLDDNSANVIIAGNTVAHCSESGIYIHNSRQVQMYGNTLFNNERQVFMQHDNISPANPIRSAQLENNILFAKNAKQHLVYLKTIKDDIAQFGPSDNNFFSRPFSDKPSVYTSYIRNYKELIQHYDLPSWQEVLQKDKATKPSPVSLSAYKLNGLLNANSVANSRFDKGITGVYTYTYAGTFRVEWNSGGKLDGGSLQATMGTAGTNGNRGFVIMDVGPVVAGKTYVLRYSLLGSNNKGHSLFLRKTGAPYNRITDIAYARVSKSRTENEVIFTPTATEAAASILFDISDQANLWFDNITFQEASVSYPNADDYIRFEYNATPAAKTVMLDATYVDAKNKTYGGSITLQPFTSVVLIKTTATIRQEQSIRFDSLPDRTNGDAPFTLSANATSGLPVSFRVVSGPARLAGNTLTLTGAGTVSIEASQAGNSAYNAAAPVVRSFDVKSSAKQKQTISFGTLGYKFFGVAPFALKATASSGLPVSFRVVSGPATVDGNMLTLTGTGSVSVEAFQDGNSAYLAASPVVRSFTSAKASQSISFPAIAGKAFGDAPFTLNAKASSGLPVSFRVVSGPATISDNRITLTGTGLVKIAASQAGDANYNAAATITQSFTVDAASTMNKQSQSIAFDAPQSKTFGDEAFVLSATTNSGLPVDFRVVEGGAVIEDSLLSITDAGWVKVEATQPGDEGYLAATPITRSFYVAKAQQWISFEPIDDKPEGGASFALSATASSGLPVSYRVVSGPATLDGDLLTATGTGTVTIEATQPGDDNYLAADAEVQSFTVSAAAQSNLAQTISFGTLAYKTYTSPPFELVAEASSDLPVSYRVVSGPVIISGNTVTIKGVGTVVIEAYQNGNAVYNAATPVRRSFTVGKASQYISFGTIADQVLGDPAFTLDATSTSGLPVAYRVVSGPGVVKGNQVSVTGTGTVVIEASQNGNGLYKDAVSLSRSFDVLRAETTRQTEQASAQGHIPRLPQEGKSSLQVFPNPVANTGSIRVMLAESVTALIMIYDLQGRPVKQLGSRRFEKGETTVVSLPVTGLPGGTYVVRIVAKGVNLSQLFQVIR